MEALQMLKYMIRESCLSFTDHLSSFEWVQDMLVKQARAELGQDADFNTFEELLSLV
ncbi:hypothetical protein EVJ58_g5809 [Rhodofomes roseus]|uniref:Uncharacterized protein n=1 Tax=Rhodofomes roseus TaxID=34475 RepID=A0A4Y9YAP2_9APHY|nr:hypothetical protein EVJ58_g5809 [Rhodofomes roseus]